MLFRSRVAAIAFSNLALAKQFFPPPARVPDFYPVYPLAVSNPVFVDVDGNGRYDAPLGAPAFCSAPCDPATGKLVGSSKTCADVQPDYKCLAPEQREAYAEEARSVAQTIDFSGQNIHVLLVEDIVDSGLSARFLLDHCREQEAATVALAALLLRDIPAGSAPQPDYVGIRIPEGFVVGYGLDDGGRYRNWPDIRTLPSEIGRAHV